jgi:hypothetical protein
MLISHAIPTNRGLGAGSMKTRAILIYTDNHIAKITLEIQDITGSQKRADKIKSADVQKHTERQRGSTRAIPSMHFVGALARAGTAPAAN